jgi:glycerol uptake facilitator-like aquaporin
VGVQLLAVFLAHLCILSVQNSQQPWKGRITWMAPKQKLESTDEGRNGASEFLEEFVAVTALLVGYVHLAYLNAKEIFGSKTHLFSPINSAARKQPIPLEFMVQLTLLVAGLLRAFPTAHLSPHVSLYVALMGYTTWGAFGYRMLGGIAGFVVAYVMFWSFYTWRTRVHGGKTLLCCRADPEEYQEDDIAFSSDVLPENTNPTIPLIHSDSIRINAARGRPELIHSDSVRSNASRGPAELVRDHTPASSETPATRQQSISFNNTYRHVYRAI